MASRTAVNSQEVHLGAQGLGNALERFEAELSKFRTNDRDLASELRMEARQDQHNRRTPYCDEDEEKEPLRRVCPNRSDVRPERRL